MSIETTFNTRTMTLNLNVFNAELRRERGRENGYWSESINRIVSIDITEIRSRDLKYIFNVILPTISRQRMTQTLTN